MLLVTLRNLSAHKRRLLSTFAAVVLGVAFLSGVVIQTATLQHKFETLFDTSSADVDVMVRSDRSMEVGDGDPVRPPLDPSVLDRVAAVDGVERAAPDWVGTAVVIGRDGKAVGTFGPPQLGLTWQDDPRLNPYRLVEGAAPQGGDQVVLDRGTAESADVGVGDRIEVLLPAKAAVTVSGIATFGDQDSPAGATSVLFAPEGAAAHLAPAAPEGGTGTTVGPGSILVAAEAGADLERVAAEVREAAGAGTETLDRAAYRQMNRDQVDDIMGFLRPALLTFALIALVVAAFSIYNTFAIIVAQRSREAALLRAIGASRRQTRRAVLVESVLVGLVASLVGLAAGIGVAAGLGAVLDGAGMDMPGGLRLEPAALVTCVLLGTGLTVLCALGPAVRASRVAPVEALRDAAIDRTATSRTRLAIGLATAAIGVGTVLWATAGSGGLAAGGVGVLAVIVALVVLGPVVAGPAGRFIGQPLRLRGVTGDLARQNAVRNPRRTASSSSALMIGVAIVALFTVVASSIKETVDDQINEQFGGDLIVTSSVALGFDSGLAVEVADLPEVSAAAGLSNAVVELDGRRTDVGVSDIPQATRLVDVDPRDGDLDRVVGPAMAISEDAADDHGWHVGSEVAVTFLDGSREAVTVAATYATTDMAGDYLLPTSLVQGRGAELTDDVILIDVAPGVSAEAGRAAVERVVDDLPTAEVRDRAEFAKLVGEQINTVLYLVYGMLGLSILIALMGIANTLSLSTFERVRELGLLRAVGQVRRQTRTMVRLESLVVAAYGTLVGLAVGVVGAWVVIRADDSAQISRFQVPTGQLVAIALLGALAGVLASVRPAARAAKLDPLAAIAAG